MRVSETAMNEILQACKILGEEGREITVDTVHKTFAPNLHRTTVGMAMTALADRGSLLRKKLGKAYIYRFPKIKFFKSPPTPSEAPDDPSNPAYWADSLNRTVASLETLKESIPALLAGLLDLSRDLERLSKVREILGNVKAAARRNV